MVGFGLIHDPERKVYKLGRYEIGSIRYLHLAAHNPFLMSSKQVETGANYASVLEIKSHKVEG